MPWDQDPGIQCPGPLVPGIPSKDTTKSDICFGIRQVAVLVWDETKQTILIVDLEIDDQNRLFGLSRSTIKIVCLVSSCVWPHNKSITLPRSH